MKKNFIYIVLLLFIMYGCNSPIKPGVVNPNEPVFTPESTSFAGTIDVSLSADSGAVIYWKTQAESAYKEYSAPITINETTTISSYSRMSEKNSEVVYATYTLTTSGAVQPDAPLFNPGATSFSDSLVVSITAESDAVIFWKKQNELTFSEYTSPITISETTTLQAYCSKSDLSSSVASASYTKSTNSGSGYNIDKTFWGSWLGIGSEAVWYISGDAVLIDGNAQILSSINTTSLSLNNGSLTFDSENILKYIKNGSTIPLYLYRSSGPTNTFTAAVSSDNVSSSSGARSLSSLGGLSVIIQNMDNPSDVQALETDASGGIIVDEAILGDNYEITIPVQEGITSEVSAEVTPLYDGQNLGVFDLLNSGPNFKMNLRTNSRMDLLRADGITDHTVYVDISNIGNADLDEAQYKITAINGLQLSGQTADIVGTIQTGVTKTINLQVRCPQIATEWQDMELEIEVTDVYKAKIWTETLSLRFLQFKGQFELNINAQNGINGLIIDPEGIPTRIQSGTNTFSFKLGDWTLVFGGGGSGFETKYGVGLSTPAPSDFNELTDASIGEPNNQFADATALLPGGTVLQYLGSKDVDFYSFNFDTDRIVTFVAEGSAGVPLQTVSLGGKVAVPSDPVYEPKVFAGWYSDAALADRWDFDSDTVNNNIILYAKWLDPVQGDFRLVQDTDKPGGWFKLDGYVGTNQEPVIPSEIINFVSGFTPRAFENAAFSKLTVPLNVTIIPDYAFYNCINLNEIKLPAGLQNIGSNAFVGCTSLESIALPEGLVDIGERAFGSCTKLRSINIPSTVQSIGIGSFSFCSSLEGPLVLPEGLISIENEAFYYCSKLDVASIPSTVRFIGERAFSNSASFSTGVILPDGLSVIKKEAFYCSNLSSVSIPSTITSIEDYAFYGTDLKTVSIPSSVTTIGYGAFHSTRLTTVQLNDGLKSIGSQAFYKTDIVNISIPDSVTDIGSYAFAECHLLETVDLPVGITEVKAFTFKSCSLLENIVIPSTVKKIGESAFGSCYKLPNISLPAGLEILEANAFSYCNSFTTITIPETVSTIGTGALSNCALLTEVSLLNSTPLELIEYPFPSTLSIFVPAGSLAAYHAADVWKDYSANISEASP